MCDEMIIRRATVKDIDFLVDCIVSAEKSNTDNFGLARVFGLSEDEMRDYITAMLNEEIDGCEFSVSSFLVAEYNRKVVSGLAGWVEGLNEEDLPSSILKSNLISYCLPVENVKNSRTNANVVHPLQIEREEGTYQLEYAYTIPEYRGKGLLGKIIDSHEREAISKRIKRMQLHVFDNNPSAIRLYENKGFFVSRVYESKNPDTTLFFPSNIEFLMEKNV